MRAGDQRKDRQGGEERRGRKQEERSRKVMREKRGVRMEEEEILEEGRGQDKRKEWRAKTIEGDEKQGSKWKEESRR